MDYFVRDKLIQWKLSDWIYKFKDQGIDTESFYCLEDEDIRDLIPKVGPRVRFKRRLKLLKVNSSTEKLCKQKCEESSHITEFSCLPRDTEKRKLELKVEPNDDQPTTEQHCGGAQFSGIDSEALCDLEEKHIDWSIPGMGPILKFQKGLNWVKEEQNTNEGTDHVPTSGQQEGEEATGMTEVLPSTSDTGKRKLDPLCESSKGQPAVKRKRETNSVKETRILNSVKNTMGNVLAKINNQDDTNFNTFLKTKIKNLEIEKKELVGVFGKSGAGKTSLINAVLGEKDLLPSGYVLSCTSVMIKVEANKHNERYEAEIEFISKEEWEDELGSLIRTIERHDKNDEDEYDYHEAADKLTALYGEEWREKSCEKLMEPKYFKGIWEFLHSEKKTLGFESATDLSTHIVKYTRNSTNETNTEVKQWFWPIVKSVTVRVPKNTLLQHVTLVDLPGNGDRNKSGDSMWKRVVGNCSTAWVVAEINRAAADKESWDILKEISSQLGNGGECRHIHFICTKSDDMDDLHEYNKEDAQALILKRNMEAKRSVNKELNKLKTKLKKHFSDECFQVFTVSSKDFFRGKYLSPENTEIPRLREFLQNLNDSVTLNYVSGAHGILSLIQGTNSRKEDGRNKEVCEALEKNLSFQTELVRNEMKKIKTTFEECLQEGVKTSITSCDKIVKYFLFSPMKSCRGFHRLLKKAVQNGGIYKPNTRGKKINLNMKLASSLTDSINEEFRNTFPNEGKSGPFNGVINKFTLDTEGLKQKYKEFELQLMFLKSEEDRLKTDVEKSICKKKKTVYRSLTKTVEEAMQDCYKKAAAFEGPGSIQNMRDTIEKHVHASKNTMFEDAKNAMMTLLQDLMVEVLEKLQNTMKEYIEISLRTDEHSIPDVSAELQMVQKLHEELLQSS